MRAFFWERYSLNELSDSEWEALCDGCAKCCLKKLLDGASGKLLYTGIACRLLDTETCRCRDYAQRHAKVAECIDISVDMDWCWMPVTCAYRLRAEGKLLPDWHPLVSGSTGSVHNADVSVQGKVFSEENVHPDELEHYIVRWVENNEHA